MLWCLDCPLFRPFRCDNSLSLLSRTGLETAVSKVPLAGQGGSASQTEGQQGQARLSKQAQGYVFLRRRTLRRSHQQRSGIEACSCGGWGGSGVGPSSVGFPAWLRSAAGEPRAGRQRWGWLRAETAATRLRNPSGPELGALLPAGLPRADAGAPPPEVLRPSLEHTSNSLITGSYEGSCE